jgi:UDPglucose 6-dehydrogenase
MSVNETQKVSIVAKIKKYYGNDLSRYTFGIWGLAFKPETDDVREAPALYVLDELLKAGATIKAYDPEAIDTFKVAFGPEKSSKIQFVNGSTQAISGADALVICTEWNEFRRPDFDEMKSLMKTQVIFDGRNLYDLDRLEETGFIYFSVGRRNVNV